MEELVRNMRIKIDGLAQLTEGLKPLDALWGDPKKAPENAAFKHIMVNSKQINQAVDSLYLAKAWLGKVLEALSEQEFTIEPEKAYEFNVARSPTDVRTYTKLGKDLGEAEKVLLKGQWLKDNKSPYKSGYKTVEDIEPTADVKEFRNVGIDYEFIIQEGEPIYWKDLNHIQKVDFIREEIKQVIKSLPETKPSSRLEAIAWTNTYSYLSEARFWLGFELQRIKESKPND